MLLRTDRVCLFEAQLRSTRECRKGCQHCCQVRPGMLRFPGYFVSALARNVFILELQAGQKRYFIQTLVLPCRFLLIATYCEKLEMLVPFQFWRISLFNFFLIGVIILHVVRQLAALLHIYHQQL